jgi:hypothetical protein
MAQARSPAEDGNIIESGKIIRVRYPKHRNAILQTKYEPDRKDNRYGLVSMHEHLFHLRRTVAAVTARW